MDDDITLLKAVRNLDQGALETVFDRFAPILYKYALRLTGNPAEADDIVGDVFAELLKHLEKGQGPRDNLRSYLFQIAYHKIVDHARDRKRVTGFDGLRLLSSEDPLHSQGENREQLDALEAILQNKLSEDQRQVMVLRFIEDFSIKETAEIIGKNVNNVKIIQNRAIAKIRKLLDRPS